MSLYPVNLKIENQLCLIIGGGLVASRKAKALLDGGAEVRVISPVLGEDLQTLADEHRLQWFARDFAEGDLQGAFLVFAATDNPEVQQRVAAEAQKLGKLLNSADDPAASDFHVPAHFRRGNILVTVATGGGSPALAKELRIKLEGLIGPEYEAVIGLIAAIREEVIELSGDSDSNAELLRRLLENDLVELILQRNWFEVQMVLLAELPEEIDSAGLLKNFLEKYDQS